MEKTELINHGDIRFIEECKSDCSKFVEYILPFSYRNFIEPPHLSRWADRIQLNKRTATLSARKHLKSTLMYAYTMWKIFKSRESEEWLYMSYTEPMSRHHTSNIKKLISKNPFFKGLKDLTNSEGSLRYTWNNRDIFSVSPASILRFNRGWHGQGVICDDILADPTNELNLTIINTITNTFFEEVASLPIEGGELHLVGTPQHQQDLFFQIKENAKAFDWKMYPAIIDENKKEVLWPELFSYKRLMEIRNEELRSEKAFRKEYMCSPLWSEDAYFKREVILKISTVEKNLPGIENERAEVIAGLDIGKVTHPSHFCIFHSDGTRWTQVYQAFFDNWEYTKQVNFIKSLVQAFKIKKIYYDDTRGELETFQENNIIEKGLWMPVKFTAKEKFEMASNFARLVDTDRIRLINNQRQINSILSVNNNLDALETNEGHGDAFWSISLALKHRQSNFVMPIGALKIK